MISAPVMIVPSTELESATFCSASKRSIQLSYEGKGTIIRNYNLADINRQGIEINKLPTSSR